MISLISKYRIPIIGAILVGVIMIVPHIVFIYNTGESYRDIYQLSTDSEDVYLARMNEIIDGHPLLGAVPYAEYKDRLPMMFPTIYDFIVVVVSFLFKISLPTALLAIKTIFPALLFFLVYQLVLTMCTTTDASDSRILTAFAGASAVVMAYDLTNWGSITHLISNTTFLLWSRPVNPITGALLLIGLVLILWRIRNNQQIRTWWVFTGGVLLALMISSYFFSWGFALAFMASWAFLQFITGHRRSAYTIVFITLVGLVLASPYLYLTRLSSTHPDFVFAAAKQGLFHTHAPVGSTIIIIIGIFLTMSVIIRRMSLHEDWWRYSVALTVAGIAVLNQQVVTGITIWPFHFIQYIKPFSAIIIIVIFYHVIRPRLPRLFPYLMIFIISVSFMFGIAVQTTAYRNSFAFYSERQRYGDLFQWLDANTLQDCTILSQDDEDLTFTYWIPAFTHCNSAVNRNSHYIVPPDRVYHDFLVILRMRGVTVGSIHTYLKEHHDWAMGSFYGHYTDYPIADAFHQDQVRENILDRVEKEYSDFLKRDFLTELKKYQIDYVIADGALRPDLIRALHLDSPIATPGGVAVYQISY